MTGARPSPWEPLDGFVVEGDGRTRSRTARPNDSRPNSKDAADVSGNQAACPRTGSPPATPKPQYIVFAGGDGAHVVALVAGWTEKRAKGSTGLIGAPILCKGGRMSSQHRERDEDGRPVTVTASEFRADSREAIKHVNAGKTVTVTNADGAPRLYLFRQSDPLDD